MLLPCLNFIKNSKEISWFFSWSPDCADSSPLSKGQSFLTKFNEIECKNFWAMSDVKIISGLFLACMLREKENQNNKSDKSRWNENKNKNKTKTKQPGIKKIWNFTKIKTNKNQTNRTNENFELETTHTHKNNKNNKRIFYDLL